MATTMKMSTLNDVNVTRGVQKKFKVPKYCDNVTIFILFYIILFNHVKTLNE
jgi:hypothetical protein